MSCQKKDLSTANNLLTGAAKGDILSLQEVKEFIGQKNYNTGKKSSKNNILNNKSQIGEPDLLWDKSFETELVKGFPVLCVPSKNAITSDLKLNGVNRNGFRLMVFQHNK